MTDLQSAVQALTDALSFTIGSTGNQKPGSNPEQPCPGGVEGGTEDIYDFNQDGVPDYAQMALAEALYIGGDSRVRDAVDHMANALRTKTISVRPGAFRGTELEGFEFLVNALRLNLPGLLEAITGTLGLIDLPEGVGETRREREILFNQAIDALTYWAVGDNPAHLERTVCIEPTTGVIMEVLTGLYDVERSNLNRRLAGHAPLGDGTTVLDRWVEAAAQMGVPLVLPTKTLATEDPEFLAAVDNFLAKVFAVVPGDINGDGQANAIDVQIVINAALGLAIPQGARPDMNADGTVDAIDVQLVINAVLGLDIRQQLGPAVRAPPGRESPAMALPAAAPVCLTSNAHSREYVCTGPRSHGQPAGDSGA